MKLRHWCSASICVAAVLAVVSAAAEDQPRQDAAANNNGQAALVEQGKSLYAQHCSHCHGFNLVNPGTVAFDLRRFPADDKPRFVDSVTHGKNGRMPPWGDVLGAEQIDELWAYIRDGGKS